MFDPLHPQNSKPAPKPASSGLLDLKTELLRAQSQVVSSSSSSSQSKLKPKSKKLDPKFILPPSSDSTSSSRSTSKKHKKRDRDRDRGRSDDRDTRGRDSKRSKRKSKSPEPDWAHIQASLAHKSQVYDSLVESGGGAQLELACARGDMPEASAPLIDFVAKRYDQIVAEEAARKERKKNKRRLRDSSDSSGNDRSRSRSPTERHRRRRDKRDRYRLRSSSRTRTRSRSRSRSRSRRRRRRSSSPDETIFSGRNSRAIRDRYISDSAASDAESMVEIEDEFGRTRRVPRSLAHQYDPTLAPSASDSDSDADDNISRYFAFTPLPELPHYESTREVRTLGAGYYQLAQDSDKRQAQMEQLRALREETLAARKAKADEMGVDSLDVVKPVVAGLHNDPELDPALQVGDSGEIEKEAAGQGNVVHDEGKEPLDARLIRRVRLVMRRRIKLLGVDRARQVEWTVPVPESVYEDLFVTMANEQPLCEKMGDDCARMNVDE
ncbi:hypothetical protein BCR44DRAFT_40685 [Catenaria anguillulae PL171]|uniref:Uncharacterized protein n=1 Tax=Catenaria anguillulae PL171 TaxID=765915 RepID=A0A1Y2H8E1_9FUNG|nr:hypothetical protein BCR44DRAFT_40685 [Catenaria anguillulae PL171]